MERTIVFREKFPDRGESPNFFRVRDGSAVAKDVANRGTHSDSFRVLESEMGELKNVGIEADFAFEVGNDGLNSRLLHFAREMCFGDPSRLVSEIVGEFQLIEKD